MYTVDPRPYLRLTAEQRDNVLRQVALYFALQDSQRSIKISTVAAEGAQLELFPIGTSEHLDVSNV
jgi:hypothetical protein